MLKELCINWQGVCCQLLSTRARFEKDASFIFRSFNSIIDLNSAGSSPRSNLGHSGFWKAERESKHLVCVPLENLKKLSSETCTRAQLQ